VVPDVLDTILDSATGAPGSLLDVVGDAMNGVPAVGVGINGLLDLNAGSDGVDVDANPPVLSDGGGLLGGAVDLIGIQADSDAQFVVPIFPGEDGEGGVLGSDSILGDGQSFIGLDADSDAQVVVPLFPGEDGQGGVIGSDGGIGGGQGLVSLQADGEALVNVPLLDGDGELQIGGDVGSLLNAAMLDGGSSGLLGFNAGGEAFDGNVALAGDLSSALGSTLDLLTTTSSLFDVPVLDVLSGDSIDG